MKILLYLLFIIISQCKADINQTDSNNNMFSDFINSFHDKVSQHVVDYSDYIDNSLYKYTTSENNISSKKTRQNNKTNFDTFFQSKKFQDSTAESFISIKLFSDFQSLYNNNYGFNINAHIPLAKTQKRLNLFIEGLDNNNIKHILQNQSNSSPAIGINYFTPAQFHIQSKYSIGINGLNIFAQARYFINFKTKYVTLEPVQQFEVSVKNTFKESTTLYIDTNKFYDSLVRLLLFRQSQVKTPGMDYGASVIYYKLFNNISAFNISQTFLGNTKYPIPNNGIINYITSVDLRQKIYKNWLFYDIRPSINFHVNRQYRPNYSLYFNFEIFFGNLKK